MGAYTTLSADEKVYCDVVKTLRSGFSGSNGIEHRPNPKMAAIVIIQANFGVRIGDLVQIRLSDIVREGDFWRLNIIEEKTQKRRTYPVSDAVYTFLVDYCHEYGIAPTDRIFPVTTRAVQKQLKAVCEYLGYEYTNTHSFRKFAGQAVYKASGYDIVAAQEFFNHASVQTTQRYLKRSSKQLQEAIEKSVHII